MTRRTAWFVHVAVIAAGVTGLVYGWMCYFAEPEDQELALFNHPLQPDLKAWHIVLVPLLVFAVGALWRSHIWGRIVSGHFERRRSGIVLAVLLLPMIASGYLVQTSGDPEWRDVWVWGHGVTSCLWLLVYLWHQLAAGRISPDESPPS